MTDDVGIAELPQADSFTAQIPFAPVASDPSVGILSVAFQSPVRDAQLVGLEMGDPRPSNRVPAPLHWAGQGQGVSASAVEFYRGDDGGSERSWTSGTKSDRTGASFDSATDDKVRGQMSKLLAASYAGPDVVGFPEHRYSRKKALKKMRANNNKTIVSYLRKRFRERPLTWLDEDIIETEGNGESQYRFLPKTPGKVDIFDKYNEIGGRVSKEGHIQDGLFPGAFSFSPLPGSDHVAAADESVLVNDPPEPEEEQDAASSSRGKDFQGRHGPRSNGTTSGPIREPKGHPPHGDQTLFQKMDSMSIESRKGDIDDGQDKAFPDALDVQSVTGKSDSLSSRGSRTSSGRSHASTGSRDGSTTANLPSAKSHRTPKPPDGSKADRDIARLRPLSPEVTRPDSGAIPSHLPHLPHVGNTSKVSAPHLTLSDKDIKLPSLTMDARRHSTLSVDPVHGSHHDSGPEMSRLSEEEEDMADEEDPAEKQIKQLISPVPTPYPDPHDGLDSRRSLEYQQTVDSVLQSKVDVKCSWMLNIFRLYVSSNFSDLGAERTILMSKAYPRLRAYCKERGFEFQVCDMNWGIKDTSTDDHSYASSCMAELLESESISKGPYFVTLMGQKLGFQALPDTFSIADYTDLITTIEGERDRAVGARRPSMFPTQTLEENLAEIKSFTEQKKDSANEQEKIQVEGHEEAEKGAMEKEYDADLNALQTWYKLDDNSIPPVYVLQPISSHYREIQSNDKQKRLRAKNHWLVMYKRLLKGLNKYIPRAIKDRTQAERYLQTVTERELDHVVFSADEGKRSAVACFYRQITDLRKNLQDINSKDYIDVQSLKPEVDGAKFERHEELKDVKLPPKVGFNNVHEYRITWHKDGVLCPTNVRLHSQYLDSMANEFFDAVRTKLDRAMVEQSAVTCLPSYGLFEEIAQHVNFLQQRSGSFYGKKGCLQFIKEYLLGDSRHPLILCGLAGSGKTSLVAKACQLTGSWFKSRAPATVVRFVGLTSESENIRILLHGICQQISHTYKMDIAAVPEDFHALMNDLDGRIAIATSQRPLIIFIDSPDKLSNDHKGRSMAWLPSNLPENVKIVVSCTTVQDEKTDEFKALKKQCPNATMYDIPPLPQSEASFILDHLLQREGRRITDEQRGGVTKAVEDNPNPLYLRLACDHALKWRSYSDPRETRLTNELRKLILGMFASLESKHGEPLMRRALGYLTAARSGLSWTELNDLLSLDDNVMTDIANRHSPALRRMPPALWCHLKADLRRYFRAWKVDGVWVWRWTDQQLREAATERYLNAKDKAPSYHSALAEYFSGKWGDRKKPFPGNEGGACRYVDPQPLMMNYIKPSGVIVRVYNMRKLQELPFHLLHSLQLDKLKSDVLINYEWTLAKLRATSLRSVLDDLQSALTVHPNDIELHMLSETLHLSSNALLKDPNQLASQLVGRLHGIIKNDKPMSIGDGKKYQTISHMLSQCQRSSVPTLIPSVACLAQPGGVLYDLLAGHTGAITAVTASRENLGVAATASRDGSIKLWDLKQRKVSRTIEGVGKDISSIRLCMLDAIVVAVESSSIKFMCFRTASCLLHITEYIDPPVITTAGEQDALLVAFFSGSNVMRTWDVSGGEEGDVRMLKEVDIAGTSVHKDGSLCASFTANGDRVLYAYRSGFKANVINARTGNPIHTLSPPKKSASIAALGVSKDYYVVACRYLYKKVQEIHQLELFDLKNGAYLRAVSGCTGDVVHELHVNRMGSHALSVSPNVQTNTTTLAVWNLETDDHKHLAKHAHISSLGACMDLMYCLTASSTNKSLRIWNISKKVNERDENAHKKKTNGVTGLVPMIHNQRYVVAKSADNGPLSVWNVVKGKCADNAVRIERGLVDPHDVVLIRNHRVVVLSELAISSISEMQSQVFQTVYVYDLGSKKYVRKLTGVFIVPSPAQDYRLLDGELLLGLSETRDHFIAWNLESGHIKFRIKTNFKTNRQQMKKEDEELKTKLQRKHTAKMTPWDRRSETAQQRHRRKELELEKEKKRLDELRKEKENAIQQFLMSRDERILVCSYFGHHLCVFDVETQQHTQTLENEYSMLYLYVAAMSPEGKYLAHVNYDDAEKVSYVTVWNLQRGEVRKRLKREPNVCCLAMNDSATRVLFGNERHQLKVWDFQRGKSSLRRLRTSAQNLQFSTATRIFMLENGSRALIVSSDITLWDLDRAGQLAMFTPDLRVSCVEVVMQGQLIALGLRDSSDVVILRLKGRDIKAPDFSMDRDEGKELFGETTGDTSSEEEEEEEEDDDEDY